MPKKLGEFQLIEKFFKPLTNGCKASQNLSDDVAKISLKENQELIISKDMIVEDVHFLLLDGAYKIASKLLLSNLSDIASSGATPLYYTLGFSKNSTISEDFIREFTAGLKDVQKKYNIHLIGGDTVTSEKLFFSVTIFGSAKKGKSLSRCNAKAEDLIFVSGSIGDAYLGLQLNTNSNFSLKLSDKKYLLNRHFFPTPRVSLAQELLKRNLSKCAIDVSDGLLADLSHIATSSKTSAKIYQNKIPISSAAKNLIEKKSVSLNNLISGGDDYELIFTAPKKNNKKIVALAKELNINLTCIGEITPFNKTSKITLFDENNKKVNIKKYGYEH